MLLLKCRRSTVEILIVDDLMKNELDQTRTIIVFLMDHYFLVEHDQDLTAMMNSNGWEKKMDDLIAFDLFLMQLLFRRDRHHQSAIDHVQVYFSIDEILVRHQLLYCKLRSVLSI